MPRNCVPRSGFSRPGFGIVKERKMDLSSRAQARDLTQGGGSQMVVCATISRSREMVAQTTICDPPPWVRSLACARDDKSILRSFTIPNPGRENPDRGTQLRGIRLNGDC